MKTLSLLRLALLIGALTAAGLTTSFAQDQTATASATSKHASALTADEKAQLKKDTDQVLAADPDLKTEEDALKKEHDALGSDASADDKKALSAKMHAHREKVKAAVLKIDPSAAPIFDKLAAAHKAKASAQ